MVDSLVGAVTEYLISFWKTYAWTIHLLLSKISLESLFFA